MKSENSNAYILFQILMKVRLIKKTYLQSQARDQYHQWNYIRRNSHHKTQISQKWHWRQGKPLHSESSQSCNFPSLDCIARN